MEKQYSFSETAHQRPTCHQPILANGTGGQPRLRITFVVLLTVFLSSFIYAATAGGLAATIAGPSSATCPSVLQNIVVVSNQPYTTNLAGTYVPNGTLNGAPRWTSTSDLVLYWDKDNNRWLITGNSAGQPNTSGNITNLPCSGWNGLVVSGGCGLLPLPVAISPASQTITSGSSVTLTASGATSYTWSNGDSGNLLIVSNVTSDTAFSVTGLSGECSATATATVSVTTDLPTISEGSCVTLTSVCGNFGGNYKLSSIQYEGRVSYSDEEGNFLYYYAFDSNVPDHPEGWYVTDPNNKGAYYNPASTATPPLTGWQNYTYDQYTCSDQITLADIACPVVKACLTVTTDCLNDYEDSFGGTYEETGTDAGRPSLTDEDGNIIGYYLAGGDSTYPTGWYLLDPDGYTAYYNSSTATAPPTSGWTAYTDDGYGCGSITITTCAAECTAPTVTIIGNQAVACGQSLTLTAAGDTEGVAFEFNWSANAASATSAKIVVQPASTNTVYSVTMTNPDTGCSGVASVTAMLTPTIATVTPPTVIGVLGGGNCPINISAMGTGNGFSFTGPDGYLFSTVYRKPNNYTVKANGIKSPGTYTMTASYTDACGQTSTTNQTFVVTGTGCN